MSIKDRYQYTRDLQIWLTVVLCNTFPYNSLKFKTYVKSL